MGKRIVDFLREVGDDINSLKESIEKLTETQTTLTLGPNQEVRTPINATVEYRQLEDGSVVEVPPKKYVYTIRHHFPPIDPRTVKWFWATNTPEYGSETAIEAEGFGIIDFYIKNRNDQYVELGFIDEESYQQITTPGKLMTVFEHEGKKYYQPCFYQNFTIENTDELDDVSFYILKDSGFTLYDPYNVINSGSRIVLKPTPDPWFYSNKEPFQDDKNKIVEIYSSELHHTSLTGYVN